MEILELKSGLIHYMMVPLLLRMKRCHRAGPFGVTSSEVMGAYNNWIRITKPQT